MIGLDQGISVVKKRLGIAAIILIGALATTTYLRAFPRVASVEVLPEDKELLAVYSVVFSIPFHRSTQLRLIDVDTRRIFNCPSISSNVGTGDISWLPSLNLMFFEGYLGREYGAHVISTDGSLDEFPFEYREPANDSAVSPSGTYVAFVSQGEIYVSEIESEDGHEIQLTHSEDHDSAPNWSPDGATIVFQSRSAVDQNHDIYRVRRDGTGLAALTDRLEGRSRSPQWSPDGMKIGFIYRDDAGPSTLWIMDADGSNPRAVLPPHSSDDPRRGVFDFTWSPDSKRLAVVSGRDGYCGILLSTGSSTPCTGSIYLINVDGTDLVRLTYYWQLSSSVTWIH